MGCQWRWEGKYVLNILMHCVDELIGEGCIWSMQVYIEYVFVCTCFERYQETKLYRVCSKVNEARKNYVVQMLEKVDYSVALSFCNEILTFLCSIQFCFISLNWAIFLFNRLQNHLKHLRIHQEVGNGMTIRKFFAFITLCYKLYSTVLYTSSLVSQLFILADMQVIHDNIFNRYSDFGTDGPCSKNRPHYSYQK